MPNKSISMNKIRQVLRCYASGSGTKSISSMLSVSRNTVKKKYLHIYQKSGLSLSDILSMDDSSLCSLFQEQEKQPEEMSSRYKELHSLFPDYAKRLKKERRNA